MNYLISFWYSERIMRFVQQRNLKYMYLVVRVFRVFRKQRIVTIID